MEHDAASLHAFYASPLGQVTGRLIRRRLRDFWPDVKGARLLGYGYATPFLRPFLAESESTVILLPEQIGVRAWPSNAHNLSAVGEEDALPFADASFDRVLIVHGLEGAESLRPLLRQMWRVLTPPGKLMIVAANRTSLWALTERSPFAQGRSFNRAQLQLLMRDNLFAEDRWSSALMAPPLRSRRLVGKGIGWEKIGTRLWPALAGVHILEASKAFYGLTPPVRAKQTRRALASAGG